MSFSGPIYVRLRERMLAFFPSESKATRNDRANFGDWVRSGTGSFLAASVDTKEIVIRTSPAEIGSVFLRDVEYLTDQCFEHILELLALSSDGRLRSEAWNVVTIYYYAFYAAQSVMRLLGEASLFFDKNVVRDFQMLAGSAVTPGAGVYHFSKRANLTATQSEYVFRKVNRKPHEAVWKCLLQILDDLVHDPALATDAGELEFFGAITTKRLFKIYMDFDWPSKVRYRTNYHAGFAYLMVLRRQIVRTKHLVDRWLGAPVDQIGRIIAGSSNGAVANDDEDAYASQVQLLHDVAHGLFSLSRCLYSDLSGRRKFDARWEVDRRKFFKMSTVDPKSYPFLFLA